MVNYLSKVVVIDIESTCWRNDWERPKNQVNDIIELGICLLDIKTGEIENSKGIIVRPERSKISQFCTELTTLTQQDVNEGISFPEACSILKKEYETKFRPWASFGNYDREQIRRQCVDFRIEYPMGPTHINIKNLAAILCQQNREVQMMDTLKLLKIEHTGIHHRGYSDALNIAKILRTLIMTRSNYEEHKEEANRT